MLGGDHMTIECLSCGASLLESFKYCPQCGINLKTGLPKIGRNDPCRCGSGKNYKDCCLGPDKERAQRAREQQRHETIAFDRTSPVSWKGSAAKRGFEMWAKLTGRFFKR